MRIVTEAVFAAEPEDMSALWVLSYISAAGGLDALINTRGGAQQERVVGGTQRIAVKLAELLGDRVMLNQPVRQINWQGDGVRIVAESVEVRARRAIIAVPQALSIHLRYGPALPRERELLAQRMPAGRVIKTNVVYARPFWRDGGFSGQANSDTRLVSTVFDNTPTEGTPGVLVGFLEGRAADIGAQMGAEERHQRVIDDLTSYFGPAAGQPTAVLERDWTAEEYTRGCYGAFTSPGALTRFGPAIREPVGPLHWAGAESAVAWTGYIDGAIESAHRAAAEVDAALALPSERR